MKITFVIAFLLYSMSGVAQQQFAPVNPEASIEAKNLLKFFYDIKGKHILSGQHNYIQQPDKYLDSVKSITGVHPAIWGNDFIWSGTKDNGQEIVNEAIKRYKQGYVICLMFHQGRPIDNPPYGWKESVQAKLTDEQWQQLITPGTDLNNRWLKQIDQVAEWLKQLRDAHVPVLWRPYHEMNGVWFWWGNRKGKDGIAKLWKMMYDRYTNYHHLNNLLWVWGANGLRDIPEDEAYTYKDYYPGAKYVDVLGADIYHSDYEQSDYNELLGLANGKLIALTEVGELPNLAILKAQPEWAWFMVWSDFLYKHNTPQQVKDVYLRPEAINLENLSKYLK